MTQSLGDFLLGRLEQHAARARQAEGVEAIARAVRGRARRRRRSSLAAAFVAGAAEELRATAHQRAVGERHATRQLAPRALEQHLADLGLLGVEPF